MINFLQPEWALILLTITGIIVGIVGEFDKKKTKFRFIAYAIFLALMTYAYSTQAITYDLTHPIMKDELAVYNDNTQISAAWYKENIMSTLPPQLFKGIGRIIITQNISRWTNQTGVAVYTPWKNTIAITPQDIEEMKKSLAHETAHNYWQTLPIEKQTEWKILHNATKTWPMFLNYRRTKAEEDFAEETSDIIVYRSIETDEKKLNFLVNNYLTPQGIKVNITEHEGWYEVER